MSKHKHFHSIKNPMQALQHARRERICQMDPGRAMPKKKTARSAANTTDGKETPHDS